MIAIKRFKSEEFGDCQGWVNFLTDLKLPARAGRLTPTYGGDEDTDRYVAGLVKAEPYGLFVDVPEDVMLRVSSAISAVGEAKRIEWNFGTEVFERFKRELFQHHIVDNKPLVVPAPNKFFTLRLWGCDHVTINSQGWMTKKTYTAPLYDWVRLWEASAQTGASIPEPPTRLPDEMPPSALTAEQAVYLVKGYKPVGNYAKFTIGFQGNESDKAIEVDFFAEKRCIWVFNEPLEQPKVLDDELEQEIIRSWGMTWPIAPMEHMSGDLHFIEPQTISP